MTDLFRGADFERLPMPDGELYLLQQLELARPHDEILEELIRGTPWRAKSVKIWGKTVPQPRLVAWYGSEIYSYSGITMKPEAWTDTLMEIRTRVEEAVLDTFNSVLLNYYRDRRDSMGLHSDDEPELGRSPVIASLSLGEQRNLIFKHKTRKELGTVKLPLPSGSLLLMKGLTQRHWKHGIPKETRICGPRVNLTFRKILQDHRQGAA